MRILSDIGLILLDLWVIGRIARNWLSDLSVSGIIIGPGGCTLSDQGNNSLLRVIISSFLPRISVFLDFMLISYRKRAIISCFAAPSRFYRTKCRSYKTSVIYIIGISDRISVFAV